MASVRTYITETEFARINDPQSSTTYIVLDDNDNINHEGEVYIVQDEFPTPSGAISITANGENIDVKQYATANVNVPNPSTGTLNITANNDYDVTDYAGVSVNVPNPSTGTLNITSNNTYDVTDYASVDVNVPTGEQKTCSFKFASNGNFTFNKLGDGKYYLKKNDGEWTEYTTSQTVSVVNGDIIELKSALTTLPDNNGNERLLTFSSSVSFEVEGDILGTLFGNILTKGGGYEMFKHCTGLTKLPSNMFANYTYIPEKFGEGMFRECTSLTTAPALPATILSNKCYSSMLASCTSLTTAPELPATTLATGCYEYMFYDCRNLTTAPELPATTLATGCYSYMFRGCTILNYIKCLATSFGQNSLSNWVQNVAATGTFVKDANATWTTGTSGIPNGWTTKSNDETKYLTFEVLEPSTTFTWTDTANNNSIEYSIDEGTTWATLSSGSSTPALNTNDIVIFKGSNLLINDGIGNFSSSGQFNVRGNIMSLIYGDNFISQTTISNKQFKNLFKNCTGLINAKNLVLPTSLANNCYEYMFNGCTSLTTAPELPATTLAAYCYQYMFQGCTNLTKAPELPATTLAAYCYQYMFQGCTSLTTAPELPVTTLAERCYANMFNGCTGLTTAPELPATTVTNHCYDGMFVECTSLTTAPELPATRLEIGCYDYMFYKCRSLNYIKCLATNIAGTGNWVSNVSATGTFVKDANTTWSTGTSGIPSGWTVEDAA